MLYHLYVCACLVLRVRKRILAEVSRDDQLCVLLSTAPVPPLQTLLAETRSLYLRHSGQQDIRETLARLL